MDIIRKYPLVLAFAALVVGVLIGRSNLFGYSSAEECAAHAPTKYGAAACFDIYPSVAKD